VFPQLFLLLLLPSRQPLSLLFLRLMPPLWPQQPKLAPKILLPPQVSH
jgi:hypothetical protein